MQHFSPIYYLAVIFIAVLVTHSEAKRKYIAVDELSNIFFSFFLNILPAIITFMSVRLWFRYKKDTIQLFFSERAKESE